jgi:hypothetical protein
VDLLVQIDWCLFSKVFMCDMQELQKVSQYPGSIGVSEHCDQTDWDEIQPLNVYLLDKNVGDIISTLYSLKSAHAQRKWAEENVLEALEFFSIPFSSYAKVTFGCGSAKHRELLKQHMVHLPDDDTMFVSPESLASEAEKKRPGVHSPTRSFAHKVPGTPES